MNVYLLGSTNSKSSLSGLLSKWNIQKIDNEQGFKSTLDRTQDKVPHFIMEVSEVNEKKYTELKAISARYNKKIKFIVFYQTLTPSPVINKLHGSEILLIGPEERSLTPVLLKRFFQNPEPLFRRWERFQLVTSGTLSLLSDAKITLNTEILNFGAHGAEIELTSVAFKKKDFIVLEYCSHDCKKIRMQSRIVWTKQEGVKLRAGIQFISREL